jgi:NAD-dependent dihydropyrimidine dehydrogenase PreA subunit
MIFTTFYFSGTGNTRWVVEQFNGILEESSHQAASFNIDNFNQISKEVLTGILKNSAYIGLAHPIYGADVPPIMKQFICLLTDIIQENKIPAKPLYIINTFGYINAFGPFAARKLLDRGCYKLKAYCNIRLCNNVSTHSHKTAPITDEKLSIRKQHAVVELHNLIKDILSNKKHMKGIGFYLLPGMVIRKISNQSVKKHYQTLSVQTSTCTKCMLCVQGCPTHSISFADEQFLFSATCTACMRCYNFCPTASVLINEVFTAPQDYFRYRGPVKS